MNDGTGSSDGKQVERCSHTSEESSGSGVIFFMALLPGVALWPQVPRVRSMSG